MSIASTSATTEMISPKPQIRDIPKDTISPPTSENRTTKIIKYTKTEATSPYVKSSSIAGLAPLVKRTGLSSKLKSTNGAMHSHEVNKTSIITFSTLSVYKPSLMDAIFF